MEVKERASFDLIPNTDRQQDADNTSALPRVNTTSTAKWRMLRRIVQALPWTKSGAGSQRGELVPPGSKNSAKIAPAQAPKGQTRV